MRKTIEELNEMYIKVNFIDTDRKQVNDVPKRKVNEELLIAVQEHRKVNGITTKFSLLRNFVRTRKFIKTTICV